MLKVAHDDYYDDPLETLFKEVAIFALGITLIVSGLIGAFIAYDNSQGDILRVVAGHGGGSIVGIVAWYLFGRTLVERLLNSWYLLQSEEEK